MTALYETRVTKGSGPRHNFFNSTRRPDIKHSWGSLLVPTRIRTKLSEPRRDNFHGQKRHIHAINDQHSGQHTTSHLYIGYIEHVQLPNPHDGRTPSSSATDFESWISHAKTTSSCHRRLLSQEVMKVLPCTGENQLRDEMG